MITVLSFSNLLVVSKFNRNWLMYSCLYSAVTYHGIFSDGLFSQLQCQRWATYATSAQPWLPRRSSSQSIAPFCSVCDAFTFKLYLLEKSAMFLQCVTLTSVLLHCWHRTCTVSGVVDALRLRERICCAHMVASSSYAHRSLRLKSASYPALCHIFCDPFKLLSLVYLSFSLFNSLMSAYL